MINANSLFISAAIALSIILAYNYSYCSEAKPEDIVIKYYTADSKGARLSWETNNKVKSLVAWQEEPGWDVVFVVDTIGVNKINKIGSDYIVEVRYKVIGILNGDDLLRFHFNELVDFMLVKESNSWKIKQPIIPPHVSVLSLKEHLKHLISIESNETRTSVLQDLVERLDNLGSQH